ncbi:UNVERIFIED_CONTAM: hypothetical protein Slati_4281400 [Sesamum latifolium]|uniref:Uncharacterized protein n=1 Tax=Sesamum latifolium TaxID=2727402 RepID=A0AAW2TCN2_9LAMI
MCKHLWDVVQHNSESIWITWIYQYRLKRSTIWTANPNTGSWSWRKILQLRNQLIDHIRCTVGTGATLMVWQDPWHPFGVFIHRFPQGPQVAGIPLEAQLSVVIQNGASNWSAIRNIQNKVITDTLPPLEGADRICWNGSNDFTTREAYHLLGPYQIARNCFILWLAILERLSTLDRAWW